MAGSRPRTPRFLMSGLRRITEPWRCHEEGLPYWRERILFSVYLCGVSLALFAFVPGIYRMIAHGGWWVAIVNTLLYAIALTVFFFPTSFSFRFRALFAVVALHLIGICVLSMLGPYSGGFIWLFSSAIMGGLLLGVRAGIAALGANALTLTALGLLLASGKLPWSADGLQAVGEWIPTCFNFIFLNALTAVSAATMMRGLEHTLLTQQNISAQLAAERHELMQAHKQLRSLAVELIEAEENERLRIAALLHDDLQQLLAAAKMQLEAVADHHHHEPALDRAGHILREAIEQSRSLAHELSPPVLHHSGIAGIMRWLARRMSEQFGLTVELETHVDQLHDNPMLKTFLFRATHELLFNVIKHAAVKHARVVLSGSDTDLSISVIDKGRGFIPDTLHASHAGFGLMSIRERANYIGGGLSIESAPGAGSRFTLTVPLHFENDDKAQPQPKVVESKSRIAAVPDFAASGATRVLFADDHHVMRQGLIRLVSGQPGIHVVGEAANGREAVDHARHLRPNVIVMDVSMPEMDGLEATRRIKAEMPEIKVVGLSMYEDEHVVRMMMDAGADNFVSKSASSAELLKVIYGVVQSDLAV